MDLFSNKDVDLAICDSFNMACVEASIASNIPFIITSTHVLNAGTKKRGRRGGSISL